MCISCCERHTHLTTDRPLLTHTGLATLTQKPSGLVCLNPNGNDNGSVDDGKVKMTTPEKPTFDNLYSVTTLSQGHGHTCTWDVKVTNAAGPVHDVTCTLKMTPPPGKGKGKGRKMV